MIKSEAWCFPRPRVGMHCYSGGFPAHFEMNLLKRLGFWPSPAVEKALTKGLKGTAKYQARANYIKTHWRVLHSFGGKAEYGIRLDLRTHYNHPKSGERIDMPTDIVGDAHYLPFSDNMFDCIILDPPFSPHYAKEKWDTKPPKFKVYSAEASRVCKDGGYIIIYHWIPANPVVNTIMTLRILMEGRKGQHARIIHVRQKDTAAYLAKSNAMKIASKRVKPEIIINSMFSQ